jgi:hypothetical protein
VRLTLSAATSAALPGSTKRNTRHRKAERHFEKLNDKFGTAPREICLVAHLILQPVAFFLLPALCNSILRVAINSRQLSEVMMVSFDSTRTLNE